MYVRFSERALGIVQLMKFGIPLGSLRNTTLVRNSWELHEFTLTWGYRCHGDVSLATG